jgi:hypothetical protein
MWRGGSDDTIGLCPIATFIQKTSRQCSERTQHIISINLPFGCCLWCKLFSFVTDHAHGDFGLNNCELGSLEAICDYDPNSLSSPDCRCDEMIKKTYAPFLKYSAMVPII